MADYNLSQYNALCEAIALGATTVKYSDKEVQYRSLAEMLRLKNIIADQLGINRKVNRRKLAEFDRGFE